MFPSSLVAFTSAMLHNSLPCTRMREQELCDWGWCPFIYIYIYLYVYVYDPPPQKKSLNGTLAVDLPFQTLAVDFSLNL